LLQELHQQHLDAAAAADLQNEDAESDGADPTSDDSGGASSEPRESQA